MDGTGTQQALGTYIDTTVGCITAKAYKEFGYLLVCMLQMQCSYKCNAVSKHPSSPHLEGCNKVRQVNVMLESGIVKASARSLAVLPL